MLWEDELLSLFVKHKYEEGAHVQGGCVCVWVCTDTRHRDTRAQGVGHAGRGPAALQGAAGGGSELLRRLRPFQGFPIFSP